MQTIEEVNAYLRGETTPSSVDSQTTETQPSSTPAVVEPDNTTGNTNPDSATPPSKETATQTGDDQPPKDDKPRDEKGRYKAGEEDLGDPSKLPYPKATKPTNDAKGAAQYKANKAFIKQKSKYKAKIQGLEAQISNLQAQLAATKKANVEGLDPEQANNLKFDQRLIEHDIKNLAQSRQAAIDEYESAQADEIHQSRIEKCFTDQAEIDHYNKLLENGRDKFVEFLSQVDPENAVLQYLDDTDNSPLLVRLLMTRPEVLKSVISKRSPMAKAMELKSIENRLLMNRKLRQTSPKTPPANPPQQPVVTTGRVVGNPGGGTPPAPKTMNDWNAHLKAHP
jgi:hypothetical protein